MSCYRLAWLSILIWSLCGPALPGQAQESAPAQPLPLTPNEALDRAADALRRAEKDDDNRAQHLAEANELISAVQQSNPQNPRAEFYRARVLILSGQSRGTLSIVERYTRAPAGADDWEGFKVLADLEAEGTAWTLARSDYEKAAKLNPREAELYLGMAKCSLQLGKVDEAIKQLEIARGIPPSNAKVYDLYAQALLRNNQVDAALAAARSAVELAVAEAKNNPGVRPLREADARYGTLEAVLTAAIFKSPQNTQLYLLGVNTIQSRQGISYFLSVHRQLNLVNQGIAATQPRVPVELNLERARLSIALGRIGDASSALDEVDKIDPTNSTAKQYRDALVRPMPEAPAPASK